MTRATVPQLLAELPRLRAEADALVSRAEFLLGAADELAKLVERAAWHARGLPGEPAAPVPVAHYVAEAIAAQSADPRPAKRGRKASGSAAAPKASRRPANPPCALSGNTDNSRL
jgi:hypothetical protein